MNKSELIEESFILIKDEIENLIRKYGEMNSKSWNKIQHHLAVKEQDGFQIQNEIDMALESQANKFYDWIIKDLKELLI